MTIAQLETTPQIADILTVANRLTATERLFVARWLLDSVLVEEVDDDTDWQQLSLSAFETDWDNEEDTIYDSWRTVYILNDWQRAGLLKPSFVRSKVAAIEPALIVLHVGQLSAQDMDEVDRRLRIALALTRNVLSDVANEVDFLQQSPAIVQTVAEKSVAAVVAFSGAGNHSVNPNRLRSLLE